MLFTKVIVDKYAEYAGQPVAIVIADTQANADRMAKAVTIQYKALGKLILTIDQAIEQESFHDDPDLTTVNIGNTGGTILLVYLLLGVILNGVFLCYFN